MTKSEADKHKVPETKNTEEGSPSRNIARKHDHDPHKQKCPTASKTNCPNFSRYYHSHRRKEKKQHGGGGGKGKWNEVDDGSMDG
mmetsp:Transcript_7608/g.16304  ORF Transcript_7608/g.16304 Transcript_7608/m.16304 type:complete len:85 (-) Transcript_7608:159-413(-)